MTHTSATKITHKHELKNCPRCQGTFECKVGDVANCQCTEVTLSEAARQFLEQTNYDCLCKKCLAEINGLTQDATLADFPRRREQFVEGLHFYKENGLWVFTEFYHLLRGRCCQSGCRHCAYGYPKTIQS